LQVLAHGVHFFVTVTVNFPSINAKVVLGHTIFHHHHSAGLAEWQLLMGKTHHQQRIEVYSHRRMRTALAEGDCLLIIWPSCEMLADWVTRTTPTTRKWLPQQFTAQLAVQGLWLAAWFPAFLVAPSIISTSSSSLLDHLWQERQATTNHATNSCCRQLMCVFFKADNLSVTLMLQAITNLRGVFSEELALFLLKIE
jgi:hypothetical protein